MKDSSLSYARHLNLNQTARYAKDEEIKKAGLKIDLTKSEYPGAGLPLCSDGKIMYVDNLDNHTLIEGATGAKKTRNIVMPMLNVIINAGESFIVSDPKGELYSRTSGAADKKGYKVIVINLRDIGLGDMWNPFSLPYELYHAGKIDDAVMLLNDFVSSISELTKKNTKDIFWVETACALGIATLVEILKNTSFEEFNINTFVKMCYASEKYKLINMAYMTDDDEISGINYRGVMLEDADRTMDCILVSLFSFLRIFINQPNLMKMLSGNTFDIRSIGKEKTAVYLIVPDEKTTNHALVSIFLKQAYEILITQAYKEQDGKLPLRVNYVLDEFCNIPKIPDMSNMISAARSRNMRFFLISQSSHQLKQRYGEDAETIKGNCENRVFITSKERELLNEISELCGEIQTEDGRYKKLISQSELQHFDKAKGEVLIIHARQYPYVTFLPDIDEYEMFKGYEPLPMKSFDIPEVKTINLDILSERVKASSNIETDLEWLKKILAAKAAGGIRPDNHYTEELVINNLKDIARISHEIIEDNDMTIYEIYLLRSLLDFVFYNCRNEERNVATVLDLLHFIVVDTSNNSDDMLDQMFDELKGKDDIHTKVCLQNYYCYRNANNQDRTKAYLGCKKKVDKYIQKRINKYTTGRK